MERSERKKYLFKNTVIFTLGTIGTRMIMFFLVPLYTNCLNTSEYGMVDLITTLVTILTPIVTLNISEGIMRFALDKNADINAIFSIGIVSMICSLVLGLFIIPVFASIKLTSSYTIYIYLYTISSGLSTTCLYALRGKEKLILFAIGTIIQSLGIACLNILFLVVLNQGVCGYLKAYIIAYFITAVYAFIVGGMWKSVKGFIFKKQLAWDMFKYSIVLVPNSIMWWVMNSSDRLMITYMIGPSSNGVYAISSKVPTILSCLSGVFIQAWNYSAIKEAESEDKDSYSNQIFNNMNKIMILGAVSFFVILKPFMRVFVSNGFYEAWRYVPFLLIGVVFMTMGSFLSSAYTVHKDSWGFLKSGTVGALLNIILNFLLIPRFGIYGAAFATCFSYFSVFVYRIYDTRKYIELSIFNRDNMIGIFVMISAASFVYAKSHISYIIIMELIALLVLYRRTIIMMVSPIFFKFMKWKK